MPYSSSTLVFCLSAAPQFTAGGYGSAGCSGCMPLGGFEMTTVPPQSPSFFAATLAKDLLALAPAKSERGD